MKTKEELNVLKEEIESVNEKLAELTPEEIAQVSGGIGECDHFVSTGLEVQITELEITTNS